MKLCSCCGVEKPLTEFYPRAGRGEGAVVSKCKACSLAARAKTRASESPEVKELALQKARTWKQENAERHKASKAAWNAAHPEAVAAHNKKRAAKWRANNLDEARKRVRDSRAKKPDYYKEQESAWRKANPGRCRAKYKAYMARKAQAMPSWANEFFIEEAYHLAQLRSSMFGFPWHVDHVVPLTSKLVCGLHTETNLQVIPGVENLSKNNRYWPDMPVGA